MIQRILIVDDERDMIQVVSNRLEAEGWQVDSAGGGDEALRKVGREVPDLILLDVMMPEPNGYQVLRRLREDPRTAHVPVVLLTARAERSDRYWGMEAGATAYIAKPFRGRELVAKVRECLGAAANC